MSVDGGEGRVGLAERLREGATMLVVALLSLLLLAYVGLGEAERVYPRFQVERLKAQAEVVQLSLEPYLKGGLPLQQYPGFKTQSDPIIAHAGVDGMAVIDREGHQVFENGDRIALLPVVPGGDGYERREDATYLQVAVPLRNRFEQVGELLIGMHHSLYRERIAREFRPLPWVVGGASIAFGLFAAFAAGWPEKRRMRWIRLVYLGVFAMVTAVVVGMLVALYADGAQSKASALSDSLRQRLGQAVAMGLDLSQMDGIEQSFADYRALNRDIEAIALTLGDKAIIHTDPKAVGKPWTASPGAFEFSQPLLAGGTDASASIHVSLPADIVYRAVARSTKNFAVLFVASAFIAALFFQLASALRRGRDAKAHAARGIVDEAVTRSIALEAVKPLMFIGFFVENLSVSFLPQLMQRSATASGLGSGVASAMFMTYFLCFAASLLPSGMFAAKRGPKPLIYGGALMAALGMALLATTEQWQMVVLSRVLSGFGQGMLFIGVQSFILAFAPPGRRTQGAAIIVYAYNGGMISGMTIGSLLVNYMHPSGVFTLGAATVLVMAIYAMVMLPKGGLATSVGRNELIGLKNIFQAFRFRDFSKAIFLVGIPAKAVLTGVVIFALPLILSRMQMAQEDIGQIIMFYALGVLLASGQASKLADRTGRTEAILFWGTVASGVGLLIIGGIGSPLLAGLGLGSVATTILLLAGVSIVGLAHGFINAPVVSHVAASGAALAVGEGPVTALYRFVERIGHVAGPLILGRLLAFGDQSPAVIGWVGAAMILFAVLFIVDHAARGGVVNGRADPA